MNQFKEQPLEQLIGIDGGGGGGVCVCVCVCVCVWGGGGGGGGGVVILSVPLEEDLLGWGCDGIGDLAYFYVLSCILI